MKKLNAKKNTNKPEIPGKVKKGYRIYAMSVLALTLTMSMGVTAFAAGDPITVVNNLSDFIFGLIRAVGLILLGWGIVQVGLSFQSHDPSQRWKAAGIYTGDLRSDCSHCRKFYVCSIGHLWCRYFRSVRRW